ncbi:MAG TPA: outer membrane protein transport protein [Polyangiaceae bacterium]|nr:outer membrane protein transport protein [Polyangiaceae bacterium]
MRRSPIAIALLFLSARAQASGFHIDEQDARATGRAGAVTASARNASTIYYNPAGIAELEGLELEAGVSRVAPSARFRPSGGGRATSARDDVFYLPHAYASYRLQPSLAFGVGLNAPFGLSLSWPASSPGRAIVRDISLNTLFIMPTVGVNLSRWARGLSLGVGVDLVPANVSLERDILFGSDVGTVALSATAFGVGGRAGLLYRPRGLRQLSLGLTYRTPVKLSFSGTADFDAPAAYRASLPPDGDARTKVTLPQTLDLGVAFAPVPEWELELDANWLGWSSFDELALQLPADQKIVANRDWRNTIALRVGTEYTYQKRWSGRLGFIWDQGPVPTKTLDFQLPDVNRVDLTVGAGAAFSKAVRADIAALYVLPGKATTSKADPYQPPVKGEYRVHAWVLSLSVGVTFDVARTPEPQLD